MTHTLKDTATRLSQIGGNIEEQIAILTLIERELPSFSNTEANIGLPQDFFIKSESYKPYAMQAVLCNCLDKLQELKAELDTVALQIAAEEATQ